MKTSIIKLSALLFVCCAMLGCGKNNQGSVYGTVTDFTTGDPVSNANVRLNPRGETTLTGSDGTFQFYGLSDGQYSLSLSKNGYVDLDDDYVIEIENGNSVHRDVQLNPSIESFRITVNGVETDTMYFNGTGSRGTFLVTNSGSVPIDVYGTTSDGDIVLFEANGTSYWNHSLIQPNQGHSVKVYYDSLSSIGYIYINSSQISKTIVCIEV